jgi:hypothetical protein
MSAVRAFELHFLAQVVDSLISIATHVPLDLVAGEQVDHGRREVGVRGRQRKRKAWLLGIEGRKQPAILVEQLLFHQRRANLASRIQSDLAFFAVDHTQQLRERRQWNLAKSDTALVFVLVLQAAGEVLVALVGHDERNRSQVGDYEGRRGFVA